MINKTINKFKWYIAKLLNKIDRMFEIIGYNFVGYKVDIKALEERIKAVEKDSEEITDYLYSNIQDSTIGTGLNWKLSNLNNKIEAVEVLFNNINEINYINKKGSK